MKTVAVYIALAAALTFAGIEQERMVHAAAESGAGRPQDEKKGEVRLEKDHEGKRAEKDSSSKEIETPKRKKSSPGKEPRLKYRDDSRCPC